MARFFRTYRMDRHRRIDGVCAMVFIRDPGYVLSHISIYADGIIDCFGLVDFTEFKEQVRSGRVVTRVPEGAEVEITFLARFNAQKVTRFIDPDDLVLEVADEIERLNGRSTRYSRCLDAWKTYQRDPSLEHKERLRVTYEAVPKYMRRYLLGDMDLKDFPIREALGLDWWEF